MTNLSFGLKTPALITLIAGLIGSIYAAYNKINNISWAPAIWFALILILYFIAIIIEKGKEGKLI